MTLVQRQQPAGRRVPEPPQGIDRMLRSIGRCWWSRLQPGGDPRSQSRGGYGVAVPGLGEPGKPGQGEQPPLIGVGWQSPVPRHEARGRALDHLGTSASRDPDLIEMRQEVADVEPGRCHCGVVEVDQPRCALVGDDNLFGVEVAVRGDERLVVLRCGGCESREQRLRAGRGASLELGKLVCNGPAPIEDGPALVEDAQGRPDRCCAGEHRGVVQLVERSTVGELHEPNPARPIRSEGHGHDRPCARFCQSGETAMVAPSPW